MDKLTKLLVHAGGHVHEPYTFKQIIVSINGVTKGFIEGD